MRLVGSIALCAGVACGGGGSGDGAGGVTGTLGGVSFSIADAVSASITQTQLGQTVTSALIWMGDTSDICGDIDAHRQRPGSKRILIGLEDGSGSTITAPTSPATYPVNTSDASKAASLSSTDLDGSCQTLDAGTASATGGTVTLTAIDGSAYAGTFDVTFDSGDHLTGSFDPSACPDLQMLFSPLYGTQCM